MTLLELAVEIEPKRGVQGALWRAMRVAGVALDTAGAYEVVQFLRWFVSQQPKILHRFDPAQNDAHTLEGLDYWRGKFDMYLSRAEILGFDSPQGRQSVCEFAATAIALAASVWRLHGPPASVGQDFRHGVSGLDAATKP